MARVRVTRRAGLLEALAGFEVLLPLLQTKEHLARVTPSWSRTWPRTGSSTPSCGSARGSTPTRG